MADPATTGLVIGGAGLKLAGGISSMSANARAEDAARQEAEYNAKQLEYDAMTALMERSTAINQQLARGRADIATGQEAMSSAGNVGSSAQSQVFGSAMNLEKDLAAISYKYTNEAIRKKNAAAIQRYNAKIHKRGRTNALIGGLLNIGGSVLGTAVTASGLGLFGTRGSTFTGAVTNDGMYGAWAG